MRVYTQQFIAVAVSAQQDLFQIEALITPITLLGLVLGQETEEGDAVAESLGIIIARITDDVTDDALVEAQMDAGDAVMTGDTAINETSELTTGIDIVHADAWNIALPYVWMPPPEMRIIIEIGNALVVNLNETPADAITMSGTVYLGQSGS